MSEDNFFCYLKRKKFIFDEELIENFLLSLRVKPFVILTGNSGTGKTKLAQLFAKYMEDNEEQTITIYTKITEGLPINQGTPSYKQFLEILPCTKIENIPVKIDEDEEHTETMGYALNAKVINLKDDAKKYLEEMKEEHKGECIPLYLDINSINESFSGKKIDKDKNTIKLKKNSRSIENGQWNPAPEDLEFIPINKNKLKGVGIGKIYSEFEISLKYRLSFRNSEQIEEKLNEIGEDEEITFYLDFSNIDNTEFNPKYKKINSKKYEIVPVGANWTDNRNILGYENIITDSYNSTPTLELILRAKEDLIHPYFLILDEMNLSHVERYFADFLSAIESGEPITLYNLKQMSKEEKEEKEIEKKKCQKSCECYNKNIKGEYIININGIDYKVPPKLTIPPNLFIIGTINVDETTYMFSPKVLDRANVLEFETFPIKKYMYSNEGNEEKEKEEHVEDLEEGEDLEKQTSIASGEENKDIENETYQYKTSLEDILNKKCQDENIKKIRNLNIHELQTQIGNEKEWKELCKELNKFQCVLKESGFDFGFRVTNEILRYIVLYKCITQKSWEVAFDNQIKQKILPKLHGSENVIGETIKNLIKLTYYGAEIQFEDLEGKPVPINEDEDDAKYKNSYKKLVQMKKTLDKQRYVSFIN